MVDFDWAGATAKHIGTVSHRILQDLAGKELERSDSKTMWDSTYSSFAYGMFRSLGFTKDGLLEPLEVVRKVFLAVLGSGRGRWLFSSSHTQVCSELVLSSLDDSEPGRVIIDRTFVDRRGTRWIVDFKTGMHKGGGAEQWLDNEWKRYLPQLKRYARVLAAREQRKTKLALYFPILDAWRSADYTG